MDSLCSMIKFISLMFVRIKMYKLNVKLIFEALTIGNFARIQMYPIKTALFLIEYQYLILKINILRITVFV